jgi:hypothetical protein
MTPSTSAAVAQRVAWTALPRRAPPRSPIEAVLGERVSGPFTVGQIHKLRAHVARSIPPLPDSDMDRFLGTVVDSDVIVSAYFRPTRVCLTQRRQALVQLVLPFDFAMEAARKAAAMPALLPQERALAWLAAFTYPIAHFYAADTGRGAAAFTAAPDAQQLRALRQALLEDALRGLRGSDLALADTLAAALGYEPTEVCDVQQVARLMTAVRLATLRIEQLWREVGHV